MDEAEGVSRQQSLRSPPPDQQRRACSPSHTPTLFLLPFFCLGFGSYDIHSFKWVTLQGQNQLQTPFDQCGSAQRPRPHHHHSNFTRSPSKTLIAYSIPIAQPPERISPRTGTQLSDVENIQTELCQYKFSAREADFTISSFR